MLIQRLVYANGSRLSCFDPFPCSSSKVLPVLKPAMFGLIDTACARELHISSTIEDLEHRCLQDPMAPDMNVGEHPYSYCR